MVQPPPALTQVVVLYFCQFEHVPESRQREKDFANRPGVNVTATAARTHTDAILVVVMFTPIHNQCCLFL